MFFCVLCYPCAPGHFPRHLKGLRQLIRQSTFQNCPKMFCTLITRDNLCPLLKVSVPKPKKKKKKSEKCTAARGTFKVNYHDIQWLFFWPFCCGEKTMAVGRQDGGNPEKPHTQPDNHTPLMASFKVSSDTIIGYGVGLKRLYRILGYYSLTE